MSNINNILSGLDKVKSLGGGRYVACCPVHDDKNPSLSIRDLDDDSVIAHCFGCGANGLEVVNALGLDIGDLFPANTNNTHTSTRARKPFSDRQILMSILHEATIVQIAANDIVNNVHISDEDNERVALACSRIRESVNYGKQ